MASEGALISIVVAISCMSRLTSDLVHLMRSVRSRKVCSAIARSNWRSGRRRTGAGHFRMKDASHNVTGAPRGSRIYQAFAAARNLLSRLSSAAVGLATVVRSRPNMLLFRRLIVRQPPQSRRCRGRESDGPLPVAVVAIRADA